MIHETGNGLCLNSMRTLSASFALLIVDSIRVNTLGLGNTEEGDDGTAKLEGEEDP